MTLKNDFMKIETVEDYQNFQKKYKGTKIKMDEEMVNHINAFYKRITSSGANPNIHYDYFKKKESTEQRED